MPVEPVENNFYADSENYIPVPDPDKEGMPIAEWSLQPCDAIAFDFLVPHGAQAKHANRRRQALSLRFVGKDALC